MKYVLPLGVHNWRRLRAFAVDAYMLTAWRGLVLSA